MMYQVVITASSCYYRFISMDICLCLGHVLLCRERSRPALQRAVTSCFPESGHVLLFRERSLPAFRHCAVTSSFPHSGPFVLPTLYMDALAAIRLTKKMSSASSNNRVSRELQSLRQQLVCPRCRDPVNVFTSHTPTNPSRVFMKCSNLSVSSA